MGSRWTLLLPRPVAGPPEGQRFSWLPAFFGAGRRGSGKAAIFERKKMSNQWHYEHDGQQLGPISPEALKQLARAGQIKPTDLIWQEGTDRKVPASRAKGLFPSATPTPKPMPVAEPLNQSSASDEPPPLPAVDDAPPPLPEMAVEPPPPPAASGQWHYSKQNQRFGPITDEQLQSLAQSGQLHPSDPVWAKGMATWMPAQAVGGLKFASAAAPCPTALADPPLGFLDALQDSPGVTKRQADAVRPQAVPQRIPAHKKKSAGRYVFGGVLAGAVLLVGAILYFTSRESKTPNTFASESARRASLSDATSELAHDNSHSAFQRTRSETSPSSPTRPGTSTKVAAAEGDNSPKVVATTDGMPADILKQTPWPELPLAKLATQSAGSRTILGAGQSSQVQFSPKGHFVYIESEHGFRLWQVGNGEETTAQSQDCNYFCSPAGFSPDESSLACIDGEVLRIWNVKGTPASLTQSIPLTGFPSGGTCNRIVWAADDTLIATVNNISDWSHQVFRRKAGGEFEPICPIRNVCRSKSVKLWGDEYSPEDSAVSPDGKYWIVPAGAYHSGRSVTVGDFSSLKPLVCLKVPDDKFSAEPFVAHAQGSPHSATTDPGSCVMFSPDGRLMAVALRHEKIRTIKFWTMGSWQESGHLVER